MAVWMVSQTNDSGCQQWELFWNLEMNFSERGQKFAPRLSDAAWPAAIAQTMHDTVAEPCWCSAELFSADGAN